MTDLIVPRRSLSLDHALDNIRGHFDPSGALSSPVPPELQAELFSQIFKSILLKKKDDLKTSYQGYSVNAFLCTVAELIPQLSFMASDTLGGPGAEGQKKGINCIWKLLVWAIQLSIADCDDMIPWCWTATSVHAMQLLDRLMQNMLVEKLALAPTSLGMYLIASRYLPPYTDWIQEDYVSLRDVARLAGMGGLGDGRFLKQTIMHMEWFLQKAAHQIDIGRNHAHHELRMRISHEGV